MTAYHFIGSLHPLADARVRQQIHGDETPYPVLYFESGLGGDFSINLGNHPDPALYLHQLIDEASDALYALAQAEAEQAARPPIGEPA